MKRNELSYLKGSGFVDSSNVRDYLSYRKRMVNTGHSPEFINALHQIDDYITNPKVRSTIAFITRLKCSLKIHFVEVSVSCIFKAQ